jgi:hypothetical protein
LEREGISHGKGLLHHVGRVELALQPGIEL